MTMTMTKTKTTMIIDEASSSSSSSSDNHHHQEQRKLATLTFPNEDDDNDNNKKTKTTVMANTTTTTTTDEEKEDDDALSAFAYQPSNVVINMHRAPRGIQNTNHIATLLAAVITGSNSSTGAGSVSVSSSSSVSSYIPNNDYTNGLKLFIGLFIITPFILWILLLLGFKMVYGKGCIQTRARIRDGRRCLLRRRHRHHRDPNSSDDDDNVDEDEDGHNNGNIVVAEITTTGDESNNRDTNTNGNTNNSNNNTNIINNWIAGGDIINMIQLSKAGISRKKRKSYVLRSWRIQSIYMSIALVIPILSILLLEIGWKSIETIVLNDLSQFTIDIDTLAYSGYNSIQNLQQIQTNLVTNSNNNTLLQLLLEYNVNNDNHERDRKSDPYDHDNNDDRDDNQHIIQNTEDHKDDSARRRARYLQQQQQQQQGTSFPTNDNSDFDPWNEFFGLSTEETISLTTTTIATAITAATISPQSISSTANDNKAAESSTTKTPLLLVTTKQPPPLLPLLPATTTTMNNNSNYNYTGDVPPSIVPTQQKGILIDEWCPNAYEYIDAEELIVWTDSINILSASLLPLAKIDSNSITPPIPTPIIITTTTKTTTGTNINDYSSFLLLITETTNYIDTIIDWCYSNDWILKLVLVVLNIVNALLLANVYIVSKNNVIHFPTRYYISYLLVPMFLIGTICLLLISILSGIALLMNVDFCSGGNSIDDDTMTFMNTNNFYHYGSPKGTIQDVIMTLQNQQQEQQQQLRNNDGRPNDGDDDDDTNNDNDNDGLDLVYDAVDYFWTGCLTENPLYFLEEFSNDIDEAAARMNQLTTILPISTTTTTTASTAIVSGQQLIGNDTSTTTTNTKTNATAPTTTTTSTTLEKLNEACQRDMSFLPIAIDDLKQQIDRMKININTLSETVSCGQISPLLRQVSHGSICIEAPYSLTIIWSTSFGITILCLILLTVRAALYNSVKPKKKRFTKPRRIVEKEFEEYKVYMSNHYDIKEINEWDIDGDNGDNGLVEGPEEEEENTNRKPTKLEFVFDNNVDLEMKSTFETAITTKDSGTIISNDDNDRDRDRDDGSEYAGNMHHHMIRDDSSYGSSYDSEISDDDDDNSSDDGNNDDHDDEEQSSAIGSFMSVATKSSASAFQIIQSIRNDVKSLLLSSSASKSKATNNEHYQGQREQKHPQGIVYEDDEEENRDEDIGVHTHKDHDSILLSPPKVIETAVRSFRDDQDDDADDDDSNDDDDDRLDVSISDDSLYLPTPANTAVTNNRSKKKDTSSRRLGHPTPTSRIIEALLTPSSVISALSPIAPRKAFTFLARTKAKLLYGGNDNDDDDDMFLDEDNYTEEELNSLVQPKQLSTLTPFKSKKEDDTSRRTDNIEQKDILPTGSNHRYNNRSRNSNSYTTARVDSTVNKRSCSVSEKELTKLSRIYQPLSLSKDTGKIDEKKSLLVAAAPSFTSTSSHLRDDAVKRKHHYDQSIISRKDYSTNNNNDKDNDITNNSTKSSAKLTSGQRSLISSNKNYSSHDKYHYAAAKRRNGLGSAWPTDDSATSISSSLQRRPEYPIYRASQSSQLTSATTTDTGTVRESSFRREAAAASSSTKPSRNFHYHTDSGTTRSRPKK